MQCSVWWQARPSGYVVLVKMATTDGRQRVVEKHSFADGENACGEALLAKLAEQKACELAAARVSLEQPRVPIYVGTDLFEDG